MNRKTLFVSFLVLCLAAVTAPGAIINVPGDFSTIQGAIDAAAVKGDEIVVAAGTYTVTISISFGGKAITVRSSSPSGATIEGSIVSLLPLFGFNSGEGAGSVLDGFIIQSGSEGIRMENSSPTIRNCTVISSIGNGLFATNSHGVMEDCTVMANFGYGMRITGGSTLALTRCMFNGNSLGGVDNVSSDPSFTDCDFVWNDGRGLSSIGNPVLVGCLFGGNINATILDGGGMWSNGSPQLSSCVFAGNNAAFGSGGGMYVDTGNPTLNDCHFIANISMGGLGGGSGGGLYCGGGGSIIACTFSQNQSQIGGGAWVGNVHTLIRDCLFEENISQHGGGLFTRGPVTVLDSSFIHNTSTNFGGISVNLQLAGDMIDISDCRFIGNLGGGGKFQGVLTTVTNCGASGFRVG